MSENIVVTVTPPQLQLRSGQRAEVKVVVRNQSQEVGYYQLLIAGVPAAWATITPDQVAAFGSQETQATLTLQLPPQVAGATYRVTVRAVSQIQNGVEGRASIELSVPVEQAEPVPTTRPPVLVPEQRVVSQSVMVSAKPLTDVKLPPRVFRWSVSVRNLGRTLDAFGLCLSGMLVAWASLEPPQLTLQPSETGVMLLTLAIGAEVPAGQRSGVLYAFSHTNIRQGTEVQLTFDVPQESPAGPIAQSEAPVRVVSGGANQVELKAERGRVSMAAGDRSKLALTLLNRSGQRLAVELNAEGPPQAWLNLSQSVFTLLNDDSVEVLLNLALPGGAPPGVYPLVLRIPAQDDPASAVRLDLLLAVTGANFSTVSPLSMSLDQKRVRVAPGAIAEVAISVQNLSATIDQVRLRVEGIPANWAQFVPEALPIFAQGARATAALTLHPPADNSVALAGVHLARVVGVAQETAGLTISAPLEVELPFRGDYEPRLRLSAAHTRNDTLLYMVEVSNRANGTLQLRLSAADAADSLEFKFDPLRLQVPPGGEAKTTLAVRAKRPSTDHASVPFEVSMAGEYILKGNTQAAAVARQLSGEFTEPTPPPPPPPPPPQPVFVAPPVAKPLPVAPPPPQPQASQPEPVAQSGSPSCATSLWLAAAVLIGIPAICYLVAFFTPAFRETIVPLDGITADIIAFLAVSGCLIILSLPVLYKVLNWFSGPGK